VAELDVDHHRHVLGHFVTGVVVVTAATPDGPAGFTAQTFGSLSLDDHLVYLSAASSSPSWRRIRDHGRLAINILAEGQESLARQFATSGINKFAGLSTSPAPGGSPLLEGALAHLEGEVVQASRHGDHDLVVVRLSFATSHDGTPLAYYRGAYRLLS